MSKGRPITSTYYAGKYKTFLKDAEKAIPRAEHTFEGNLQVLLVCVPSKPKTTKRPNPNGDVDNYAKGVLDVMTRQGYWQDDMQIVDLRVIKHWPGSTLAASFMNTDVPGIFVQITEVD